MPYDWLIAFCASVSVLVLAGSFLRRIQAISNFVSVLLVWAFYCVFTDTYDLDHLVSVTFTVLIMGVMVLWIDNHRALAS